VLLLDKPVGLSSNAALQRAKRALRAEKAGHTGTLDPLASGLLPLCFGDATKFAQSLLDARKSYVATIAFGTATTTGDAEGTVRDVRPVAFSAADLEAVLPSFTGVVRQQPPQYAALKFEGRNYYEYARAGIDIPRPTREVRIDAIEILDCTLPQARLRIVCSKGTYVRVLAEDIGQALRCCAHLAALRRTASGPFRIEDAIGLAALEAADQALVDSLLLPVDAPLREMRRLDLDEASVTALAQGRRARVAPELAGSFRCYGPAGGFAGVADADGGALRAVRLVRG
jgi:tRNA pseudouridine55 synthase